MTLQPRVLFFLKDTNLLAMGLAYYHPCIGPRAREQMPALYWPRLQTLRHSQQERGQRIFPLAFQAPFHLRRPLGKADWALPRLRTKGLEFFDWVQHLMRYHDGRFAQHNRLRHAVFNTWLRKLSNAH
jgi:hypothetical protein